MFDKAKIESIKQQRIQEQESANLWYQNMVAEGRLDIAENEVAMLWYEIMINGGVI